MIELKRILAPTDFSPFSEQALRYAVELANRFEAELHLLAVVDNTSPLFVDPEMMQLEDFQQQQQAGTQSRLDQQAPALDNLELLVREVRTGSPFVEIVRYAKEKEIDLIILGTHGRTGLSHVLMGSVAELVVRKAPCPVLTVRDEQHDFVMP